MKKLIFIGIAALICSSCQFENNKYGTLSEMWNAKEPANAPAVSEAEPVAPAEGGVSGPGRGDQCAARIYSPRGGI